MAWEALTAIGSLLSAIIIAITVVLAARQLRLTNAQLEHLRRTTQLEGAMKIFEEMAQPDFRAAVRFVTHDLRDRMKDEKFRQEVGFPEATDDAIHQENIVHRVFERVGAYVKEGLLDGNILYTVYPMVILSTWENLSEVIAIQRRSITPLRGENFEYLYKGARQWAARNGYDYIPFSDSVDPGLLRPNADAGAKNESL
jgi:hypothetical protein